MSHRSVLIFLACLLLPLVTCSRDNIWPWTAATSSIAAVQSQTYHVRTDGGSAEQCTGLADAPYPGGGTNQPDAWDHPIRAPGNSQNSGKVTRSPVGEKQLDPVRKKLVVNSDSSRLNGLLP
jgi:hypothetical protein